MEKYIEECKTVRKLTMAPMKDIAAAVTEANGNVDQAIKLLDARKQSSAADREARKADNNIVYSYVHNNKIGAMIVLACQTDFVAKNEMFLKLAKDICMHIVSSPNPPKYVTENDVLPLDSGASWAMFESEVANKPDNIKEKIIKGKFDKWYAEVCLLRQKFVRDETVTIKQLIDNVSGTVGEKIEVKKFIRFSA